LVALLLTGRKRLVKLGVMSDEHYTAAEAALLAQLQAMRENESGAASLIPSTAGSYDSEDTLDDKYDCGYMESVICLQV
jgi:hypothetical protein